MAERQGFEPWDQFPGQVISSHLQSATLPPLRTKASLFQIYSENGEVLCRFLKFNPENRPTSLLLSFLLKELTY
jgi:hypothetical protein